MCRLEKEEGKYHGENLKITRKKKQKKKTDTAGTYKLLLCQRTHDVVETRQHSSDLSVNFRLGAKS